MHKGKNNDYEGDLILLCKFSESLNIFQVLLKDSLLRITLCQKLKIRGIILVGNKPIYIVEEIGFFYNDFQYRMQFFIRMKFRELPAVFHRDLFDIISKILEHNTRRFNSTKVDELDHRFILLFCICALLTEVIDIPLSFSSPEFGFYNI